MIERHTIADFVNKIHNVFGIHEQGKELVNSVSIVLDSKYMCLLFLDYEDDDYTPLFFEPDTTDNPLRTLKLRSTNPIVEYLRREKKFVTISDIETLPDFNSFSEKDKKDLRYAKIELFMPLMSRDRLMGILVLGQKQSGKYSSDDFDVLKEVAEPIAISMEKEYLREQLKEREENLLVLNHSMAIIASSLDIKGVFDSFVAEIRKVIDVGWGAMALFKNGNLYFHAVSSEISNIYKIGERVPIKDTAREWIISSKKGMIESDWSQNSQLFQAEEYIKHGVRSLAYLPLIANNKSIGGLIVASNQSNAYDLKHISFLEQLASQIAMPVENSRLYAEVEEKARIDALTGLFNRRSLDEAIATEISRHTRYGGDFSVIIVDIDSFKTFNDNYGHLAGDNILRKIGDVMKNSIRSADQAFRYGGDEFAILLPNTSLNAARQVAERTRKQVAAKVTAGTVAITISLGLAYWPVNGKTANEVLSAADVALYRAKQSGGNKCYSADKE